MSSESLVLINYQDSIAWITLNSEQNRNALSSHLRNELSRALTSAVASPEVRAIFLTHTGPVFSSGFDLTEINPDTIESALTELSALLNVIKQSPKPIVAALNGPAIAGGLGLVAASDFAVTLDTVTFSFSEVRIGVSPAIISSYVMAKCQKNIADEYLLTGKLFSAEIAERMGLVNQYCSAAQMPQVLTTWQNDLLKIEPKAFAITKKLLSQIPNQDELIRTSANLFISQTAQEGRKALKEKRRPTWDISGS